jgi:hypothetical protein
MAFLNRDRRATTTGPVATDAGEEGYHRPADRNRYARGVVRGWLTLAAVALTGFLTWLAAHSFTPASTAGDFWIAMGLIGLGGLALGLSQVLGGWTKWGVPRLSMGVLLFGWLPTAVATGWILLTIQPPGGWQQGRLQGWSDSIGILGFVRSFLEYPGVVALVFGLVTAFLLDTSGPRVRGVEPVVHDRTVPDEDVHDYRSEDTADRPVTDREHVGARTTGTTDETTVLDRPARRDTP